MKWPERLRKWKKDPSEAPQPPVGHDGIVGRSRRTAQAAGQAAEQLAMQFLHHQGLVTVARNVRWRGGEIDLICLDGETLVFVEVRLRSNTRFGGAAESISSDKRRRVITTAQWWLNGLGRSHADRVCRFDALLLDRPEENHIRWIQNAFTMDER